MTHAIHTRSRALCESLNRRGVAAGFWLTLLLVLLTGCAQTQGLPASTAAAVAT